MLRKRSDQAINAAPLSRPISTRPAGPTQWLSKANFKNSATPISNAMMPMRLNHCDPRRLSTERSSRTRAAGALVAAGRGTNASAFAGPLTPIGAVGCASPWSRASTLSLAAKTVAADGGCPRNAATSCSSWKTRAVTAASAASRRCACSSAGDLSGPSFMSLSLYNPDLRNKATSGQHPRAGAGRMNTGTPGSLSDTTAQQKVQLQRPSRTMPVWARILGRLHQF